MPLDTRQIFIYVSIKYNVKRITYRNEGKKHTQMRERNSQCLKSANPNRTEAQQCTNGRQPRHHPPSEPLHLGVIVLR